MADYAYLAELAPVEAYYSPLPRPPPPLPTHMCTCMSSVKWSSVAQ